VSIDGAWTLVMQTPAGPLHMRLEASAEGTALAGTLSAAGACAGITDGAVHGDEATWKVRLIRPIPMHLVFTGSVRGDTLAGDVNAIGLGVSRFTGSRA
jgi:hypothetical protein